MLDLVRDEAQEFLQLRIVCGGDVRHHVREDGQYFAVLCQLSPPGFPVHVCQVDGYSFPDGKELGVLVVHVEVRCLHLIQGEIRMAGLLEAIDLRDRRIDARLDFTKGQTE